MLNHYLTYVLSTNDVILFYEYLEMHRVDSIAVNGAHIWNELDPIIRN